MVDAPNALDNRKPVNVFSGIPPLQTMKRQGNNYNYIIIL